ncbi:MAG: GNAT family N-acetyltransferase [Omnitrophica bacterium]|nr:GNAT family N-acetyltransferase [Candidatus Omnitrophota bacterium]
MMEITISKAKKRDFAYIQEKIKNYLLDPTDIDWRDFFVARLKKKVVAFGRIIDRGDSFEIASLGVDYYHRKEGIGKKMLIFLIQESRRQDVQKPIYGITHVSGFVSSCGFEWIKDNYPAYLDQKRKNVCHLDQSRISIVKWKGELV